MSIIHYEHFFSENCTIVTDGPAWVVSPNIPRENSTGPAACGGSTGGGSLTSTT